jgi:hypothetical protein
LSKRDGKKLQAGNFRHTLELIRGRGRPSAVISEEEFFYYGDGTMGIRETLNEKPQITTGIAAGVIGIALLYIIFQFIGGGGNDIGQPVTQQWYTVDDGKTWFAGSVDEIPPFKHEGKDAVRVHIFTCDEGTTKIVSYLERFTPDAQKKLKEHREKAKAAAATASQAGPPPDIGLMEQIYTTGMEVKKANDANGKWTSVTRPEANALRSIACPQGQNAENLRPWLPMDE